MAYKIDERNKDLKCYVDGSIVQRDRAVIPVWDSGFLHGKQIWSSPRLIQGKIFRLQDHLAKIRHGIHALNSTPPEDAVFINAVREVLIANNMEGATGVHIRIIWTPGNQVTASMNSKAIVNWDGSTASPHRIIVMPEWRGMETVYSTVKGEKAIISQFKRPSPQFADQRIHSNNQIHSSLACDEATRAGVAAALMLDANDNLAEAHASHMAIIQDGKFYTPRVECCPPGVTRKVLLEICQAHGVQAYEEDINIDRLWTADEVMIMGTMSGPIAITHVNGKQIGAGEIGPMTTQLKEWYNQAMVDDNNLFDIFQKE